MPRKFEIQLKTWIPVVIEAYFTYDSLNTCEVIKHSGRPLIILGGKGHIDEILAVIDFLIKAEYLTPNKLSTAIYFGINFDNYEYTVTEKFKDLIEESQKTTTTQRPNDWIQPIKVENTTHNEVKIYNINLTFTLEKLFEGKAGLINL